MIFLSSANIFQSQLFQKILLGTQSEVSGCQAVCPTFWIQIICKDHQHMTKIVASRQSVRPISVRFVAEKQANFFNILPEIIPAKFSSIHMKLKSYYIEGGNFEM